ncbi:hypothetical protein DHD05_18880 [Arenibacter sp. N53]|uniref:hypothetical protein n=1 Tax=Arenibacter TaxID=178469 RepID=UPI000CD4639C|nr:MULTISPECIES: hypothetical protein [Arenibacter]MCM4153662.1 hypothetical protein [Arenibacter sp. N53]
MVGIFKNAEMKNNGTSDGRLKKVISKALNELKTVNSYDRKKQWKDNQAVQVEQDDNLTPIEINFVNQVSKDMTDDEVNELKRRIGDDESGDYVRNFQKRSMARCFSTGKLEAIKTFAIDLDYPARNFRALHSK